MSESILLARLAGRQVAIAAAQVQSIVEIGKVSPVPRTPPPVEGLTTLRSTALTVINCAKVLKLAESESTAGSQPLAAVVEHEGHQYALLVDSVDDVVEVETVPQPVLGGVGEAWSPVALGMIETEAGSALMVDVSAFIKIPSTTAH